MDMKEKKDNSIERLFALSRDAVLGLRQETVIFANPAAEALLGPGLTGQPITAVLPDFPPDVAGDFVSSVTVGGRVQTLRAVWMEEMLVITLPCAAPPAAKGTDAIVQQLRQHAFSLRMALDAAFPPDALNEKNSAYAASLYHTQHSLLRLTGSLADAAALADGSFSCILKPMDLGQLCANLVDSVNHLTEGQAARVEFHCAPTLFPAMLDRGRMEQMLLQLLCNALQNTPIDGIIRLELRRQGKHLILSLDDNGCGIPPQRMRDLFSDGTESDPTAPAFQGMGLGLHIAQGIARAHGGSLILQSEEGQGTHLRLMLPARDRLMLRDSAALDRGPSPLLTELAPVLSHRAYRKEYRD